MQLKSDSFNDGAAIPGEFAFAVIDPKTHVSLSKNRNPHLVWSGAPGGDEILCRHLPRPGRSQPRR